MRCVLFYSVVLFVCKKKTETTKHNFLVITHSCLMSVLLRLRVNRADLNGPSVGDIDKVVVGVKKYGLNVHHDDWNGWVVSKFFLRPLTLRGNISTQHRCTHRYLKVAQLHQ